MITKGRNEGNIYVDILAKERYPNTAQQQAKDERLRNEGVAEEKEGYEEGFL